MTVSTTNSRVDYTGNGSQTDYEITFPAFAESHVQAYIEEIEETNFSIIGDITLPGATLRFAVAPLDGEAILILRNTPQVQTTDYTAYGQYKANQHESDFDYSMFINQELQDAIESGIVVVPLPGNFTDQITLGSSAEPSWGPAEINYAPNILGVGFDFNNPAVPGVEGLMSWRVHDAAGNQRDMNLLWDGTLDIPGNIQLDNQEIPDFAAYKYRYSITPAGAAWIREFPTATGTKRDAIVAAGGLVRTFETIAADGTDLAWTLDPITKQMTVPVQPDKNTAIDAVVATKKLVDDLITDSGAGPDPTFNSASWEHQTDPGTFGDMVMTYETEASIVTGQVVKQRFNTAAVGVGSTQAFWWITNDEAGVAHNFLMANDQLSLPALPTGATSATSKAYVDSVAGGSPDPVVDTLTFNYQQGTETVIVTFDDAVALGSPPTIIWGVPSPSLNNFSHLFQTTGPTGTALSISFVDGAISLPKDPPSPTAAARKSYVDTGDTTTLASAQSYADSGDSANDTRMDNRYSAIRFELDGTSSPNVITSSGLITGVSMNTTTNVGTITLSGASSANNLSPIAGAYQQTFDPDSGTAIGIHVPIQVINSTTLRFQVLNNNETQFDDDHMVTVHLIDDGQ